MTSLENLLTREGVLDAYQLMRDNPLKYEHFLADCTVKYGKQGFSRGAFDTIVAKWGPRYMEDLFQQDTPTHQDMQEMVEADYGEHKWVVEGLLYTGGLSILSAHPKTGKSVLARWLMCCLLAGKEWLGRQTYGERVLYYCLEEPNFVAQSDFLKFSKGLYLDSSSFAGSLMCHCIPMTINPLELLKRNLDETNPSLVVIDTLVHFTRIIDTSDYGLVSESMAQLRELIRDRDTHILLLHHQNKVSNSAHKGQLGSTAFRASTDINMGLLLRGTERIMEPSEGRVTTHLPKMRIILGENDMQWVEIKEVGDKELMEGVRRGLGEGPMNTTELKEYLRNEGLGKSNKSVSEVLQTMQDDGEIVKEGQRGKWTLVNVS